MILIFLMIAILLIIILFKLMLMNTFMFTTVLATAIMLYCNYISNQDLIEPTEMSLGDHCCTQMPVI